MNALFITLQVLLLVAAAPLLAASLRTPRSHRDRHSRYLVLATLLVLFAVLFGLMSLAVAANEARFDFALSFTPPAMTLALCAWVVRRAVVAANRPRHRRGGGAHPAG